MLAFQRVLRGLGLLAALPVTVMADPQAVPYTTSAAVTVAPSFTTSTSSGPATITIAVGANGHVFTPNQATANVGDTIKFNFYPSNHRVVRAEFGWPCYPYELANINKPGFDSGTFTPQVVSSNPPSWSVLINDTAPLFFYCAAPNSCVPNHMIGVINPNATQSYDAQLAYALNATYQLAPGDTFPSEAPLPSSTATRTGSGTAGATGAASGDGGSSSGGGGLGTGAIAGIAIGGAAVLILGIALVYLCGRRGGFDKAYRKSAVVVPTVVGGGPGGGGGGGVMGGMVEAQYANGGHPKSPGQATLSSFAGGGGDGTLRGSVGGPGGWGHYGGGSPGVTSTPSPGPPPGGLGLPGYGQQQYGQQQYGHQGHGHDSWSSQPSPRTDQYGAYAPVPVELPTGDATGASLSPPPGYQGRDSWVPGHEGGYGSGAKP